LVALLLAGVLNFDGVKWFGPAIALAALVHIYLAGRTQQ
jgi:hypothetical protein